MSGLTGTRLMTVSEPLAQGLEGDLIGQSGVGATM